MKKLALLFSALLVVAGVASASQAPVKSAKATMKTHVLEAQVVSTDAMAKTLTVKTDAGESTLKVDAPAATHLKGLKAGERVRLTCRDNAAGEHEAITHIVVEKTTAKK